MQQAQQNMMIIAQKIQDEMQKLHKSKIFPKNLVFCNWFFTAVNALKHSSPLSLGISPDEMVALINASQDNLTFYQVAVLCNNLESKSPDQLGLDLHNEYPEFIEMAGQMSMKWNELNKVMKEEVEKRVMAEAAELSKVAELQSKTGMKIAEA